MASDSLIGIVKLLTQKKHLPITLMFLFLSVLMPYLLYELWTGGEFNIQHGSGRAGRGRRGKEPWIQPDDETSAQIIIYGFTAIWLLMGYGLKCIVSSAGNAQDKEKR